MNDYDHNHNDISAEDALEETRGDTMMPMRQNDDDNPAGPADYVPGVIIPPDHPSMDSDVDETELYQDGAIGAA